MFEIQYRKTQDLCVDLYLSVMVFISKMWSIKNTTSLSGSRFILLDKNFHFCISTMSSIYCHWMHLIFYSFNESYFTPKLFWEWTRNLHSELWFFHVSVGVRQETGFSSVCCLINTKQSKFVQTCNEVKRLRFFFYLQCVDKRQYYCTTILSK